MEKILTDEQKRICNILNDLKNHQWWKLIVEALEVRRKEKEDILCWRIKDLYLDNIEYSKNSIHREWLTWIESLINYPDLLIKNYWVYKADKEQK